MSSVLSSGYLHNPLKNFLFNFTSLMKAKDLSTELKAACPSLLSEGGSGTVCPAVRRTSLKAAQDDPESSAKSWSSDLVIDHFSHST